MGTISAIIAITLGLFAVVAASTDGAFGDRAANVANTFLGLDSDTGDAVWKTQMRNNNDQSQLDRDWQEKMYYIDREYNSPANQMRLYREAGLNPSLIYGQPVQTGQLGSGAEGSYSGSPVSQLGSLLGLGQDAAMMPAQIDLMRAQAEEIRSRIPVNEQKINESKARIQDLFASVAQRASTITLQSSQRQLTDASRENISFEQMMRMGYLDLDLKKYGLESMLTEAKVKDLNASADLKIAQAGVSRRELSEMIWTFAIRKAGLEKQNLLTDAKIAEANASAAKLEKEGIRVQQIFDIDAVRADQSKTIMDDLNSDNILDNIGGMILYGIEYAAGKVQPMAYFK